MDGNRDIANPAGWFVAAASVAGSKHAKKHQPNQDALRYRTLPGTDRLVAVIADGAGSALHGRQGALTATEVALEVAWNSISGKPQQDLTRLLSWTIEVSRQAVIQVAESAGLPPNEFATTLTAFAHTDGKAAVAQIGDGACVIGNTDGWVLATAPQRGEYANETFFITQDNAISNMAVNGPVDSPKRVTLCTDGMMSLTLKQPETVPYEPYFEGTFGWLESAESQEKACRQLHQLLLSEHVRCLTDDDLTMFQATLLRPTPTPPQEAANATLQSR